MKCTKHLVKYFIKYNYYTEKKIDMFEHTLVNPLSISQHVKVEETNFGVTLKGKYIYSYICHAQVSIA